MKRSLEETPHHGEIEEEIGSEWDMLSSDSDSGSNPEKEKGIKSVSENSGIDCNR